MNNLSDWDTTKEQQKADFMEQLYQAYAPKNHLFTGLWERFKCEAANHLRDEYFQRIEFVQRFQQDVTKNRMHINNKPLHIVP
jgi:hypothetical protein